MRDRRRIHEIISLLEEIWDANPDWRFGQLISNVMGEIMHKYSIKDMFFPEDELWIDGLRQYKLNHSIFNYGQNILK